MEVQFQALENSFRAHGMTGVAVAWKAWTFDDTFSTETMNSADYGDDYDADGCRLNMALDFRD